MIMLHVVFVVAAAVAVVAAVAASETVATGWAAGQDLSKKEPVKVSKVPSTSGISWAF